MGLFTNNKKLCPICGNPTPRLLVTKVEDMPICKECNRKVDLPEGTLEKMSLADFQEYIAFYEENQIWRDAFTETYGHSFGFGCGYFAMDETNKLFRCNSDKDSFVMKFSELKAFRILEDTIVLFEGTESALKYYPSDVPERINAMSPQIAQFVIQMREYEMLERMERMQERRAKEEGDNPPPRYHSRPHFDVPVPFRHFNVELELEHPYWKSFRWEVSAPFLDRNHPDIDDYIREYETKVNDLHEFAARLMELIAPGVPELCAGVEQSESVVNSDAVKTSAEDEVIEQLQKYKALLDAGVLTEEEFAAKKRQLLGL